VPIRHTRDMRWYRGTHANQDSCENGPRRLRPLGELEDNVGL
jgi:hypothetical protein